MSNENQIFFQTSFPVQTSTADLLRGYLQYCKCCTFCFVTQLLSLGGFANSYSGIVINKDIIIHY